MINIDSYLQIDTGSGFSEEQIITSKIDDHKKKVEFDLSDFNKINRLRFHPSDDFTVLHVKNIIIFRNDKSSYEIDYYKSNTVHRSDNILSFLTKKPFIDLLLFNQEITKINFDIEYLLIGETSLDYTIKSIINNFDEAIYDESLKNEEAEEEHAKKIRDQKIYLIQLENQINALQVQAGGVTLSQKNYIKKKFDWLRPFHHLLFIDKRKKIDKLSSAPKLIISTISVLTNKNYQLVKNSGLFDSLYYLDQNPDLKESGINPIAHFFKHGYKNGKDPNPLFWTSYYLKQNPQLNDSGINPLVHYLESGAKEGRNPCPLFNTNYYLDKNPEVEKSGKNPLVHYLNQGYKKGNDPHPLFETSYYLGENPDVARSGMDPLSHYSRSGFKEKRNPGPFFDTSFYSDQNSVTIKIGLNPLAHYIETGQKKGYFPNRQFCQFSTTPKISIIVPVYNVDESYLHKCIRSVLNQLYFNWELCLVDDGSSREHIKPVLKYYGDMDDRIKISLLPENKGVSEATNEGVALATGEYIGFLDHDDELSKDALYEIVKTINNDNPDVIYTDEDVISETGTLISSWFKPDYSPDLLYSFNYITHFLIVKRELFYQVGGLSSEYEGAQDYDLILKLTEKTKDIYHIPEALYRWRSIPESTSAVPEVKSYADDAGKNALEAALKRKKISGDVKKNNKLFYYRVKRALKKRPLISIIIPFKDSADLLKSCIDAILDKSSYEKLEIIGINNDSQEKTTYEIMTDIQRADTRIQFYDYNIPFNYSKINNYGAGLARGEHIVLMNNDIEIINDGWIETLLEHSQRKDVGAVGAKLFYPNGTIQHAGIILGIGGFAGHSHRLFNGDDPGYYYRLMSIQNVSAVTGALMMVKTKLYQEMGGLDEENFSVALNDVDFCLRLRRRGYLNVFTPFCQAIHHESVTRGYEETPDKKKRFFIEIKNFKNKWKTELSKGDPFYNRNLTLTREDFSVKKSKQHAFV